MSYSTLRLIRQPTPRLAGAGRLRHSAAGYSLVSLVLGLQLIAVVGLIAVPKMGYYLAQYRLMGTSNQLAFDIARARMQAVGQHQYVRILMLDSTHYARETSTNGSDWPNQVTTTLPNGITVAPTNAEVRFDKSGFAKVNTTITVTNSVQKTKTITTGVIGRVTVA
jgi:Tfp pilus assembly protein FimT